jgi:hypothetical protein
MTEKLIKFLSLGARLLFFLPEDDDPVESEDEPDEYDETTALPQLLPASEAGSQCECAYNYSSFCTTYHNRFLHSFPRLYHP